MFSLQKLLGKEDKFFDLLEAGAEEARNSVQALVKFNQAADRAALLQEFFQSRRKEKQIREQIIENVYKTFVTVLEREDIEKLSGALYRIPKTVEKFVERLLLTPAFIQDVDCSKQISLLELATDTVVAMVRSLRSGARLEEIKSLQAKLQHYEGEADKAVIDLLRRLYVSRHDPVEILVLKDLYDLVEKAIDRCRDVGNIITNITLKNS